jgi:hypothetical protein
MAKLAELAGWVVAGTLERTLAATGRPWQRRRAAYDLANHWANDRPTIRQPLLPPDRPSPLVFSAGRLE